MMTKLGYQADGAGFLSEKITRVKKVLLTTKESATIFETDLEIHLEAIMEKSKVYSIPQRRNPNENGIMEVCCMRMI